MTAKRGPVAESSTEGRSTPVLGWLVGGGLLAYTMFTGLSMLAHLMAPGIWGWLGVAGYFAFMTPWPVWFIVGGSFGGFMRRWWLTLFVGGVTMVMAVAAGQL